MIGRFKRLPGLVKLVIGWAVFMVAMSAAVLASKAGWVAAGRPSTYEPSTVDAYRVCRDAMRDRLKAPATAEFQSAYEAAITQQDTYYFVESWVDSENAFGALLRTHYTCTVQHVGDGVYQLRTLEPR